MRNLASWRHHWFVFAERGAFRLFMIVMGLVLAILGLGLGVSMIMLPAGIVIGLCGVGMMVWGLVGDVPIEE